MKHSLEVSELITVIINLTSLTLSVLQLSILRAKLRHEIEFVLNLLPALTMRLINHITSNQKNSLTTLFCYLEIFFFVEFASQFTGRQKQNLYRQRKLLYSKNESRTLCSHTVSYHLAVKTKWQTTLFFLHPLSRRHTQNVLACRWRP
jgi:hypothetical protein